MLLEVSDLRSGYGRLTILHGVDLEAEAGRVTTLLGPNGAGKSTIMKAIAGELAVAGGDVRLDGRSIAALGALDTARAGVAYVPQERNVFAGLTVRENLRTAALAFNGGERRLGDVFARFPILKERANQPASSLSGGERQILAISTALVGAPSLLLLDEPTAGLAPMFVDLIIDWVGELTARGMGVVWVVEQTPEKILTLSETTFVVGAGRIADVVPSSELLLNGRLERVVFEMHQ